MKSSDLVRGVEILTDTCLNIRPGENVLVVTDTNMIEMAELIATVASERVADVAITTMAPLPEPCEDGLGYVLAVSPLTGAGCDRDYPQLRSPRYPDPLGFNVSTINHINSFSLGYQRRRWKMMSKELDERAELIKLAGGMLNSIVEGLQEIDLETRRRIMERGGEACAAATGGLGIARRIAEETTDIGEILQRVNEEIPWCGAWARKGDTIRSVCAECGCPLVRNKVVELTGTFCYCSRGWVKRVFETLLKKPVEVELEKSIGLGDSVCKFVVYV